LKLVANGLYVAIKEASATIPGRITQIGDFREVVELLFLMKVCKPQNRERHLMLLALDKKAMTNPNRSNSGTSCVRGAWVPLTDKKKRVPEVLKRFGLTLK
jgi:hypothetical protein